MALKYETARYEASYGTIAQLPKPTTPKSPSLVAQMWASRHF